MRLWAAGLVSGALALAACSSGDQTGEQAADASLVATEDNQGSFNTRCEFSHTGPDDPIVHAGHSGMSHQHEFFGATATDADSTAETLLAGDTTCESLPDRTAYWAPSLLVDGERVEPTHVAVYYRVPLGADATQVEAPPNGLAMIAGDAAATEDQDPDVVHWACGPRGEPSPVPLPCPPGAEPVLRLTFDPCWDGENLDSADHTSHLAPLEGDGTCPSDHPVLLSQLIVEVRYPDDGQLAEGELTLASGPVTGAHGDALMAWEEDAMAHEVETCLNANRFCDVVLERSRLSLGSAEGQ